MVLEALKHALPLTAGPEPSNNPYMFNTLVEYASLDEDDTSIGLDDEYRL